MTADRLRALLACVGWSAGTLARRLGVAERLARRWVTGEIEPPARVWGWLEGHARYQREHWQPNGWTVQKPEREEAMTPTQIRATGYVVEQYVPLGANADTRAMPWVLRRAGTQEGMRRFATREQAVAALRDELTEEDAEGERPDAWERDPLPPLR